MTVSGPESRPGAVGDVPVTVAVGVAPEASLGSESPTGGEADARPAGRTLPLGDAWGFGEKWSDVVGGARNRT